MITIILLTSAVMFDITLAGCDAIQNNIDYPGNDLNAGGLYGRVPGHLTEEECRRWCISSVKCVGYTFVKSETSRDNCAVKKSWVESSRRTNSCCNSAKVTNTCRSTTGCDDVQNNIDYPGNDLNAGGLYGRVPGHLTEAACRRWCISSANCVGYTFVKSETTRDNCAVKARWIEGSRRASSCCNSARISNTCRSRPECQEVTVNCNDTYGDGWHGGYLSINGVRFCEGFRRGRSRTETNEICGDLISVVLRTLTWGNEISWSATASNLECSSSSSYPNNSFTIINDCSMRDCDVVENNVDYPGNDLNAGGLMGRVPGHLTEAECRSWCMSNAACVGYTFVKSETTRDNCAVKRNWVEGSRIVRSCCNSARISDICRTSSGCDLVQQNVDYPGNDLNAGGLMGRVPGHLTEAACRSWCISSPACVGYTFVKSETTRDNCAVKRNWVEGSRIVRSCCNSAKITSTCRSS